MKKTVSLVLIILTLILIASCVADNNSSSPEMSDISQTVSEDESQSVEYSPEGSFDYFLKEDGSCVISSYKGNDPIVRVPKTINGATVTEIGFQGLCSNRIKIVYLPDTIVKLGSYSLSNKNLEKVVLSAGLTSIGEGTFSGCIALKEISLPDTLVSIGNSAFTDCRSLKKLEIPSSVKYMGMEAFAGSGLETVILNEGLDHIGSNAFLMCPITEITVPSTVKILYPGAFSHCSSLSKVVLNEGLETIGYQAFEGTKIAEITIPSTVVTMDELAFRGCQSVEKVYFKGAAPENYSTEETKIYMENVDYTIYFYDMSQGFRTPVWFGYNCQMVDHLTVPQKNPEMYNPVGSDIIAPPNTGNALFEIKITVSDLDDEVKEDAGYENFVDPLSYYKNWKVSVNVSENVKSFDFIELDEGYALRVTKAIYTHHAWKYSYPLLLHTYLNDFSRNRGLSYVNGDGEVIYMAFTCDMSGLSGSPAGYQDNLNKSLGRLPKDNYVPMITDNTYKWEENDIFQSFFEHYVKDEDRLSWSHVGVSDGKYVSYDKNQYSCFDIYRVVYANGEWEEYYAVPFGGTQKDAVYKLQFDDSVIPVWIKPEA